MSFYNLHFHLNKYLPEFFLICILTTINYFLCALSLFMYSHLSFKNFFPHLCVSLNFSSICLPFSSSLRTGHLPFFYISPDIS